MAIRIRRLLGNPLIRRIRRHSVMGSLFRSVDPVPYFPFLSGRGAGTAMGRPTGVVVASLGIPTVAAFGPYELPTLPSQAAIPVQSPRIEAPLASTSRPAPVVSRAPLPPTPAPSLPVASAPRVAGTEPSTREVRGARQPVASSTPSSSLQPGTVLQRTPQVTPPLRPSPSPQFTPAVSSTGPGVEPKKMDDAAWRRLETIFRKHAEKDQLEQQASSEAEPSSGSIQALPSPVEGQQTPADVPVSKVVSPKAQKRRFPFIPSFLQPAAQRRAQVEELGERTGAPQSDRLPSAGPTPVSPTKPISGLEKPIPSAPIQQKADQVAGKEGRRPPEPGRLAATPTRSEIRPVEAASTGEPVQAVPSRLSTAEVVSPEALTQLIPAGARGAEKAKVEPTLSQPVQRAPSPEVSAQLQAREVEAGVETKAEPAPLPREPRATEVPNQVLGSEVEAGVEAKAEPALLHPVQRASETEAPTQVLATGVPGVAEVKPAMVVPPAPPTRTLPDKRGRGVAPVRPQGPEAGVESVAAPEVQRAAQQPTVISAPPVSVPSPAVPGGEEGFAEETAAFEEGEVPLRPLSLEQIWPVEVLQSKPEPRPGGVETRPSPKVSEPQYLQEVAGQPVFEALKGVKPGQPTDSAVEVIAPRKPRPSAPVLQRREEAEVEPTTPVSQTQEAPSPVTTSPPAVQREVGAEETASGSEMIDTEIGLLPADLWQLIGQPPEQRRFAGQVSPVEPSAERTQMTGVHETSATGTPVSGVIQPAVDETEPEGVSAPAMPPVVHRFMEPQGRIFRVAGEEGGAAAAETAPEAEPAAGGEVNVDELALKVYGEVKRRLSVEWERFRRRF